MILFFVFVLLLNRGNDNVTLYLTWNIIPNVGGLPNIDATGTHRILFPAEYAGRSV